MVVPWQQDNRREIQLFIERFFTGLWLGGLLSSLLSRLYKRQWRNLCKCVTFWTWPCLIWRHVRLFVRRFNLTTQNQGGRKSSVVYMRTLEAQTVTVCPRKQKWGKVASHRFVQFNPRGKQHDQNIRSNSKILTGSAFYSGVWQLLLDWRLWMVPPASLCYPQGRLFMHFCTHYLPHMLYAWVQPHRDFLWQSWLKWTLGFQPAQTGLNINNRLCSSYISTF